MSPVLLYLFSALKVSSSMALVQESGTSNATTHFSVSGVLWFLRK